MNRKEYTRKDFEILRIITVVFIVIYFILDNFVNFLNIMQVEEISATLENSIIVGGLCWFVLPIIIAICLNMCMERYVSGQDREQEFTLSERYLWYSKILFVVVFLGFAVWRNLGRFLDFLAQNHTFVAHLNLCIIIKAGLAIGWVWYWIYCLKQCFPKRMEKEAEKGKYCIMLIILILLIGSTTIGTSYVDEQMENAWWERLMDSVNEDGVDESIIQE